MSSKKQLSKDTVSSSDNDSSDDNGAPAALALRKASTPASAMKRKSSNPTTQSPSKRVKWDLEQAKAKSQLNRTLDDVSKKPSAKDVGSSSSSEEDTSSSDEESESESTPDTASQASAQETSDEGASDKEEEETVAVSSPLQRKGTQANGVNGTTRPDSGREVAGNVITVPAGFVSIPADARDRKTTPLFESSQLAGKQLFVISAPADVALSSLKSMPIAETMEGSAVLSLNGDEYQLVKSSESQVAKLLTCSIGRDGLVYKQASANIEHSLQLRRVLAIPSAIQQSRSNREKDTDDAINVHDVRPIVPQPEGLRTRWWPVGFEDGDIDAPEKPSAAPAPRKANKKKTSKQVETQQAERASATGDKKKQKKKRPKTLAEESS